MDRALIVVRRRRGGWGISGRSIAVLAFLAMCAAFFCVPLYVMLVTSFKTMDQVRVGDIFALPVSWSLEAWKEAWFEACAGVKCEGLQAGFVNSLKILFPSLALSIAFSSVTGYALALWNVRWANGFLFVLFICAFVPFQIIMIPMILLSGMIGVYGSTLGIAIVHAVLGLPILTLIFRNFYKDIPVEIIQAARLDSGRFWRVFGEIMPMSSNIIVVVLILQITTIWNDFLIGITFGGIGTHPMTVILANVVISTTGEASYNVDMAAALLTAAPPLIIYFALGRLFVKGITSGAVKG